MFPEIDIKIEDEYKSIYSYSISLFTFLLIITSYHSSMKTNLLNIPYDFMQISEYISLNDFKIIAILLIYFLIYFTYILSLGIIYDVKYPYLKSFILSCIISFVLFISMFQSFDFLNSMIILTLLNIGFLLLLIYTYQYNKIPDLEL